METLKPIVSYFYESINGTTVTFLRIDDKIGFCFALNNKSYGNFVTSNEDPDKIVPFLREEARKMIHDKTI